MEENVLSSLDELSLLENDRISHLDNMINESKCSVDYKADNIDYSMVNEVTWT